MAENGAETGKTALFLFLVGAPLVAVVSFSDGTALFSSCPTSENISSIFCLTKNDSKLYVSWLQSPDRSAASKYVLWYNSQNAVDNKDVKVGDSVV